MNELRTCKVCELTKEAGEFPKNHHLYRHPKCKACRNEYQKKRRKARPELYRAQSARYRRKPAAKLKRIEHLNKPHVKERLRKKGRKEAADGRARIDAFKTGPCVDCGQTFPPCAMDFDHVRGKKRFGVSKMRNFSIENILEEIAKCDLVCANCHRIRTFERLQKI